MVTDDIKTHAEEIIALLGEQVSGNISAEDIEGEITKFLEYGVPIDQAKQTILKKYSGSFSTSYPTATSRTLLRDLEPNMRSVKILVQVLSINPKEIMIRGDPRQIYYGILGDESGTIPFTAWHEIPVEKDDIIEVSNAYTKEWQGNIQLNFGDRTGIEQKTKDDLPKEAFEPQLVQVKDLHNGIGRIDLTAKILEITEKEVTVDDTQKTVYSGVLGDETGKAPFTAWHDFDLKKNDTIHLIGGYVKSWKGISQVSFDEEATVTKEKKKKLTVETTPTSLPQIAALVEHPGRYDVQITGTVIEIQQGSGFIFRCPECNRVLFQGNCRTHGTVEGVPDVRVKCIVDDGTGAVSALLDQKILESLFHKTLDDWKNMKPDEVFHEMRQTLCTKSLQIQGNSLADRYGITFIVQHAEILTQDVSEEAAQFIETMEEEL